MLWTMFASEFAVSASRIARTVSHAPALLHAGVPGPVGAPRRPSMLNAIEDISKATGDAGKKKRMDALHKKMAFVWSVDLLLFLVVLAAVIKVPITRESYFGEHGTISSFVVFFVGLSMGLGLEAVALYIHFKELNGLELTEAQKKLSKHVLDDIHFDIIVGEYSTENNPTPPPSET